MPGVSPQAPHVGGRTGAAIHAVGHRALWHQAQITTMCTCTRGCPHLAHFHAQTPGGTSIAQHHVHMHVALGTHPTHIS